MVSDGETVPRVRNGDFRNVGGMVPLRHDVGPPLPGHAPAAPALLDQLLLRNSLFLEGSGLLRLSTLHLLLVEDLTDRDGLRQTNYVQQITIENMRARFPGRFTICWHCEAMMRHMRRVGNFHMIEHMFENVILGEPEPHNQT